MCVISVNILGEVILGLHESKNDFTDYLKATIAVDLYKNRKVSLGYCAEVAGMTKGEFILQLGKNGVSIFSFDSDKEFLKELSNA